MDIFYIISALGLAATWDLCKTKGAVSLLVLSSQYSGGVKCSLDLTLGHCTDITLLLYSINKHSYFTYDGNPRRTSTKEALSSTWSQQKASPR